MMLMDKMIMITVMMIMMMITKKNKCNSNIGETNSQ